MPELPELEVWKSILAERILNVPIKTVIVKKPMVFRCLIESFKMELIGSRFTQIQRRGKFLLFFTEPEKILVANLMLSGRFQLIPPPTRLKPATCFQIIFTNGTEWRYYDQKLMGRIYFVTSSELPTIPQFNDLGIEPLTPDFTREWFQNQMRSRRGMIKNVLTNQNFIAGIGNAYADEILFDAGILPLRKASSLSDDETNRLYESIGSVLKDAIHKIRQHLDTDLQLEKREFLKIHTRGGQPCPQCGTAISELKPDGKATNFCRQCQR